MSNELKVKIPILEDSFTSVYVDYIILDSNYGIISAVLFAQSQISLSGICARISMGNRLSLQNADNTDNVKKIDGRYFASTDSVNLGYDKFYMACIASQMVGINYCITDINEVNNDFYNFLMKNYDMPLKKEWIEYILGELEKQEYLFYLNSTQCIVSANKERYIKFNNRSFLMKDIIILQINPIFNNEVLKEIISSGLKRGYLMISKNNRDVLPLNITNLDEYMNKYGESIIKNLLKYIRPYEKLKGSMQYLALKNKKLYPQQASCCNGIKALKRAGKSYGIFCQGMGVGKTISAFSTVESYFVEKYIEKHPEKTLKDVYLDSKCINYRVMLIAPGHLLEKWAKEIENEVPYANVTIISGSEGFKELQDMKKRGKSRVYGREFYIMSKDYAKLGETMAPIPTHVKYGIPKFQYCENCSKEGKYLLKRFGHKKCSCGQKKFAKENIRIPKRRVQGLVCPQCGELLIDNKLRISTSYGVDKSVVLTPADFLKRTEKNKKCYHCGANLWGADAKNIGEQIKKGKWRKVRYYANASTKKESLGYCLEGFESKLPMHESFIIGYEDKVPGPRKTSPANYIKKHFDADQFDFLIIDEIHKFEGAGTAQAVAAHSLIKRSKFVMGLTGTLLNGKADSIFYLMWMLDPQLMRKLGFEYDDVFKFISRYGTYSVSYASSSLQSEQTLNTNSRGRQLSSPRVAPGISPKLYTDLLLECTVMLDISDMSSFLPDFIEKVIPVEVEDDIMHSYNMAMYNLRKCIHSADCGAALAGMMKVGLSYVDKPYGREPIRSTTTNTIISDIINCDYYINNLTNKEKELIEIVNNEISEERNCFIYAEYTGKAESCITTRLKNIIEDKCNLKGACMIIESNFPSPRNREKWIHKRAAEGIKVFICNPAVVETGLDFRFEHNGVMYNYPTIIFYQMGNKLSVMWQASRRSYRLNQTEECRVFYIAAQGTLQMNVVELMAEKVMAASAIQGQFSSKGLVAMAKGVDSRVKLAQALKDNTSVDIETIANMFDVVNSNNTKKQDLSIVKEYNSVKTFFELTGIPNDSDNYYNVESIFDSIESTYQELPVIDVTDSVKDLRDGSDELLINTNKNVKLSSVIYGFDIFDYLFEDAGALNNTEYKSINIENKGDVIVVPKKKHNEKGIKKSKEKLECISLFDFI